MVPPVRTLLARGPKNSPTLTGGLLPLQLSLEFVVSIHTYRAAQAI
jgi:hypothetical protein